MKQKESETYDDNEEEGGMDDTYEDYFENQMMQDM